MSALGVTTVTTPSASRAFWRGYLDERTGSYESRCLRYRAVYERMILMGLEDGMLVYDVGAGMCEFGRFLYREGWTGQYVPVDGSIDGIDLNDWTPALPADFLVAIEVVEHMDDPERFLSMLERNVRIGAVITTPNPAAVDVLALDRTHRHEVSAAALEERGWRVSALPLFLEVDDTLVGVWNGAD